MTFCRPRACCPCPRAWTLSVFSRTRRRTCLHSGKRWDIPLGSEEQFAFGAPEPIPECEPEMANAFRQALSLLRRSGISIKTVDISDMLKKLDEANDRGLCSTKALDSMSRA